MRYRAHCCVLLAHTQLTVSVKRRHLLSASEHGSSHKRLQKLRWSRGNVLAFRTQVREFAPGRSRRILRASSFEGEVKPSVQCRSFTACKRSLNVTWKSAFRQHFGTFLANSSTFRRWVLSRGDKRGDAWWRKLERLSQVAQ
jgi:hypothetical protein